MRSSGWDYLEHMIEDCEDILEALRMVSDENDFVTNRFVHKSVLYSLLNLGELMKSFTKSERDLVPQIPWKNIIGFRDRAAHGYHHLNLPIVWSIINTHIGPLLLELQKQKQSPMEINSPQQP